MDILAYNELDTGAVKPQFERTVAMLAQGDFRAADARKLRGTPFYRAKLNDSDRLLFKFGTCAGKTYLLLLEVIYHHAYDKSRFLNGATVADTDFEPLPVAAPLAPDAAEPLRYVNPRGRSFHMLGKILSFDDEQATALSLAPPLILIGSAGSGKTVLTLEKVKQLSGEILYVTHSPYLVECSRRLYYSDGYDNPKQEVEFLSFAELLAAGGIPAGKPLDYQTFSNWFLRHRPNTAIKDGHMLFEEFNGVLTGCPVKSAYLSRDEYLELGIRRSIFTGPERVQAYDLFEKYLAFLGTNGHYNMNMQVFSRLSKCEKRYDFVVVDEVQDITNVQLMYILRHLRRPADFLLSGDSNQIVHPNFFSWAAVKSMFYEQQSGARSRKEILRILFNNYRNSQAVTALANKILLVKTARFGSVDRESNYLVRCVADTPGTVELLKSTPKVCRDFNDKTSRSTRHAVIVLRDEQKPEAARVFDTPLIFSVQEAKGLEYDNIILYNMVSGAARFFSEIADGVTTADLQSENLQYARAKDKGDKSLDAFKFFINALYVAVTRSIRNIFMIEDGPKHPLFQLLELVNVRENATLEKTVSSAQEWQSEAGRLERQGKAEQAAAIRKQVLGQKPVPWRVITDQDLPQLESDALNPDHYNKKAKTLLFEYALVYRRYEYMPKLAELNFKAALTPDEFLASVQRHYTDEYRQPRLAEINRKIKAHGLDFRDPLNRTPLMQAASLGMPELTSQLVADGAAINAIDNNGRTAFMLGLIAAYADKSVPSSWLRQLPQILPPQPLVLRHGDKLMKIDPHHGLFWVFSVFLARPEKLFTRKYCGTFDEAGIKSAEVAESLQPFAPSQVPDYRKRQTYISSLLATNEYAKPKGRHLFLRFKHGLYLLNPELQIQTGESWTYVYDYIHAQGEINRLTEKMDKLFVRIVLECLETMREKPLADDDRNLSRGLAEHRRYNGISQKYSKERSMIMEEVSRRRYTDFHASGK